MEELKLLGPSVLKRKRHGIPVGIRYWLFFKRHILEKPEVRKEFEKELTRPEFAALVKKHANPSKHGPSFCRRKKSAASNARNTNDMLATCYRYYLSLLAPSSPITTKESSTAGLGVFLRRNVSSTSQGQALLAEHLYGPVFELTDQQEIEQLKEEGYPSLLESTMLHVEKTSVSTHQKKKHKKKTTQCKKMLAMCGPLSLVNRFHPCRCVYCGPHPSSHL